MSEKQFDLFALERRAEAICNRVADDCRTAGVSKESLDRALFEESIEMAHRLRARLLEPPVKAEEPRCLLCEDKDKRIQELLAGEKIRSVLAEPRLGLREEIWTEADGKTYKVVVDEAGRFVGAPQDPNPPPPQH